MRRFLPNRIVAIAATLAGAFLIALYAAVIAPPGEVVHGLEAPSPALGRAIPFSLYKPQGEPAPGERWPVLYLYHGLGGNQDDWLSFGRAAATLDQLIGTGHLKPLIVVMPDAGDSWYVDNEDPGGAGLIAEALSNDLVRHVDATWPTANCREGRAVGGVSMGGYGALLYAMDHPERFAAAISLSGSVFPPMPPSRGMRAGRATGMFSQAFGEPFDWQRFNRWNLFPRISNIREGVRPDLYLRVGSRDFGTLKRGNTRFVEALERASVPVSWRIDRGGNEWRLWSRQLGSALSWLDLRISATCPS